MVFSNSDLCVIRRLIGAPKKRGNQWIGSGLMRGNSPLLLALRVLLPVAMALSLFTTSASALAPGVEKVRVQTHPGYTRVVLETSAPIAPNLFTLGTPHRLVIDLPELQWRIPSSTGAVDSPLVKKYSFGLFQPGVSRFVLNLSGPTQVLGRKLTRVGRLFYYEIDLANLPNSLPPPIPPKALTPQPASVKYGRDELPPASTVADATKTIFEARTFDPAKAEFDTLGDVLAAALAGSNETDPKAVGQKVASLDFDAAPDLAPAREDRPAAKPEVAEEIEKVEPKKSNRKPLRIVLDPGHGGRDPGTGSGAGVKEKDINLAFAQTLALMLEADDRYEVFLTRDTDKRVKLPKRVQFARRKNADLFISIHADWSHNKFAKGATAYTLSEEASVQALDNIATKKDEVGRVAGVDLAAEREDVARLLVDLARRETQARSVSFAELVIAEVAKETPVLRRPLRKDSFHVLKAPDMPSVLLELGFLSNDTDREYLQSPMWRLKTAEAVKRAIDEWRKATGNRDFRNF